MYAFFEFKIKVRLRRLAWHGYQWCVRKGFIVCFTIVTDIDWDVLTAYCRSSSGDSVDLLRRTICTSVVVCDWCITNLSRGYLVPIHSIVGIIRGGNCSFSDLLW